MAKTTTSEQKRFKRERAAMEFGLRVHQMMYNYKSKEEPSVNLTHGEMIEVLAEIIFRAIPRLKRKSSWQSNKK